MKQKSRNLFLYLLFQTNGGEGPPVYYRIKLAEMLNKWCLTVWCNCPSSRRPVDVILWYLHVIHPVQVWTEGTVKIPAHLHPGLHWHGRHEETWGTDNRPDSPLPPRTARANRPLEIINWNETLWHSLVFRRRDDEYTAGQGWTSCHTYLVIIQM